MEDENVPTKEILISEIFGPTIQGEGALIGRPTVFVRTGGCDYRCSWCDTLYAVLPEHRGEWRKMSAHAILERVLDLSDGHPILVTLSGGNPALQPLEKLIELGNARGCTFALETQGSVAKDWFSHLDFLVLSPKPPSSNMETDWDALQDCIDAAGNNARIALKIVVFDEADYAFAREAHRRFSHLSMILQIGTESESDHKMDASLALRVEWLLHQVARDSWFQVTILPQLHVLLWGRKRGV